MPKWLQVKRLGDLGVAVTSIQLAAWGHSFPPLFSKHLLDWSVPQTTVPAGSAHPVLLPAAGTLEGLLGESPKGTLLAAGTAQGGPAQPTGFVVMLWWISHRQFPKGSLVTAHDDHSGGAGLRG